MNQHSALTPNTNPVIIPLKLAQQCHDGSVVTLPCHALIDSGATNNFIDAAFVQKYDLSIEPKPEPQALYVIDGRLIESGDVTHSCLLKVKLGNTFEPLTLDVTQL